MTKVRYDVPWKTHTIEIDIYRRHHGLVVAEVEFDNQRSCAAFEPPDWIGRDVTGKPKYSNVALARTAETCNMSYELQEDETLGDGLRRIVCHQIEGAIRASNAEQNGKGSPVHETRKHLKKARRAYWMARGEIDRGIWKREDRCLAKVGQLISEVRDAEVRLETVRQLREFARGKKRSFQETEELLAFELDSFLAAFSEWPQEAEERLTQTLDRVREWQLDDLRC